MSETAQQSADGGTETEMRVGETDAGQPYTLPVEDVLTGRGFVTGKSGAGKSNTGSVIAEELLDRGHPLLVVDVDGEYWGLKEEYEILHVGATEECDLQVGPEHAGKLAELALGQHVPIVLDVSGYTDPDTADDLVREVAHELFAREQEALQPFLMLVEEIHEFLPQQGSPGEVGKMLIRVAKRGRKRGLGIVGLSQRPANVQKDFITQADLLVWHRLTWENDVDVVQRVVTSSVADAVADLGDGEAFVQADWAEADVERVQFRRKHTFDAGATPGLDDVERPELKSIDDDLMGELEEISERHDRRQDRIEELEATVEAKEERIAELEEELEDARDLQRLGEAFIDAAEDRGSGSDVDRELLEEKNQTITDLRDERDALEQQLQDAKVERDDLRDEVERLEAIEDRVEQAERIEQQLERVRDVVGVDVSETPDDAQLQQELDTARDRIEELERELGAARSNGSGAPSDLASMLEHDAIQAAVQVAKDNCDRSPEHIDRVLAVLASTEGGGPLTTSDIEPLTDVSKTTVSNCCKALFEAGVLKRSSDGRSKDYQLDRDFLERRIEVAEQEVSQS